MDPRKVSAEWFYNTVFRDEAIRPKTPRTVERLPAMLRTARSLENGVYQSWQSRESVFMKQAKLLANYEDDYEAGGSATCYYPTYQSLTDQQLRGYFSWRTRLRRGEVRETSLSFAFLYIYELINQIGVADPLDGYHKLEQFRDAYCPIDSGILSYLAKWLTDYVVYYDLDPGLLSGSPQVVRDRSIAVLEHIQEQDEASIIGAVKRLSPKWLDRSKFYTEHSSDMDAVIVPVLRRVSAHYGAKCKKGMVEQYFGTCGLTQVRLFDAAVFCNPLKRRNYEYAVDDQCVFFCKNGLWSVWRRTAPPSAEGKLDALLKTIDSVMREAYGCRPVKPALDAKWMLRIISDEVQGLLARKQAAEEKKITIDYAQLTRIRQDAAITRERLIVDEEMDLPEEPVPEDPAPQEQMQLSLIPEENNSGGEAPLAPAEYRLLQCLLYGGDTLWVQAEGHLLSVLVDSINETLYDTFGDCVLDDTPRLVEDYIDDLKEMVNP